ncbi:hypothetical protein F8388_001514 [Cannabis sativa]|uniref:DUF4283 domain-containing protein n=1 Tax=Cannabis sativa TaxID=3483 RepID=A0A7J6EP52_CANSA|nr:hypothetical protein F8388_001510 [Cannabis sativa]KAF4359470.1 hypothetical protein F8388_001514 [Cannabis sativa]KAF4379934.1 hypothetical protein G4B88_029926 [Cannabis sativa]
MERDSEMEIEMMELFEDLTLEDIVANKACVGKIMGCKNMAASVVKKILLGIWNLEDGWRMKKFEEGVLGFFFESEADCSFVLNKRPWLVNGVLLNLKPWPLEGEVRLSEFELARFWVEFHGLPTRCLSENNIPILAKKVGQLVKSDGKSKEETVRRGFLRRQCQGSWKRRPLPVQKESGEGSSQATAVPDRSAGKMEGTEGGTLHGVLHGSGRPLCSKDDDVAQREGKIVVLREFENPPREECLNIPPKNILTELPTPDFASVGHENELGLLPDIGPSLIQSLNIPHIWTCKSQMPHHFPEPINFKWSTNDPQLQKLYCDLLGPDYTNLYKVQPSLISNPPNVSEMIVHLLGSRKRKAHTWYQPIPDKLENSPFEEVSQSATTINDLKASKTDGEGEEVAGESFKAGTSRGNPRGRRKKGETCSSFLKRTAVWTMFFMYGTPYGREKNAFWQWFSTLVMKCESNWVVCGDLNVIAEASEKRGGCEYNSREGAHLQNFMVDTGGVDLGFVGPKFMWMRSKGSLNSVRKRLDRVIACADWCVKFPEAAVVHHAIMASDHAPVVLDSQPVTQKLHYPFRFLEVWTADPRCTEVIQRAWSKQCYGQAGNRVCGKLRNTKDALKVWNRDVFGFCDQQLKSLAGIGEYFTRKFRGLYQSQNPRFDQDFEDKHCDLCGEMPENEVHLFRDCHFARCLWFSSPWGVINSNLGSLSFEDWFLWLVDTGNDSLMMFGACVMEHIWQCRNKLLFQGVKPNLTMSIRQLQQRFNEFKEILLDECKLTLNTTVNTCSGVNWDLHVRVDASVLDGSLLGCGKES